MPELRTPLDSLVADLRAQQLSAWEAGDRVALESLLADHPEIHDDQEALLHLIYAEVLLREEYGERPALDEYVRRFSACESALRRQFAFHDAFGVLGDDSLPGSKTTAVSDAPDREVNRAFKEIGPYEILGEIGRGGMGIVYKGRHRTLTTRLAAIKVLLTGAGGVEERQRFLTEARSVASLQHPNIVRIYDVFDPPTGGGDPFVALEYVEGGTLADRIGGTPLPPREAATLLLPLAEAIEHAHLRGIIHRDLKPANVLLANGATVPKVTDFGLAKQLDADSAQTRTGVIMGTPSYMAPEQASGRTHEVGPAADIYGLGAIFYEALTGRPPFRADTVLNTLAQVVAEDPVPPRSLQPGVPPDLETICLKCLNKTPDRRYASAGTLADDLRRFLRGEPILARPTGLVERAVKWVKRRPAASGMVGLSALALVALVTVWVSFTIQLDEQKRDAITQRDEARKQKDVALAERAEALRQSNRARHLLALSANAVDEIAVNLRGGKQEEIASGRPGAILFKLACHYAKTSKALSGDPDLALEDRTLLGKQYAVSAVRLLGCAKQVGFFAAKGSESRPTLAKNSDLEVLRSREDYKQFVAQLP